MTIKYYPNRIYKGKVPAIDREMAKRNPKLVQGAQDLTSEDLDVTISANEDWQLNSIGWQFSNAIARDFAATVKQGRKIVQNLNDYLWFHTPTTLPQRIILDPGFYTGTELAAELQAKMDANTVYAAAGITFTVAYDASTGLFTITPSSGNIRYLDANRAQSFMTTDSIAGHLFGLTADSSFAGSVVSDTAVFGLDSEVPFVNEAASTSNSYSHNELHTLEVDQAIHLTAGNAVAVTITYVVNYEEMV